MSGTKIVPEKITSPFQLMAAWFAMLVLIISVLLTAASQIDRPTWAASYLVIFSSIVILVVIGCVTLMLTKFRPHLQDGKEYSQWLKEQGTYSSGYLVRKVSTAEKQVSVVKQIKRGAVVAASKEDILVSIVNMVDSMHLLEAIKNKGYNAEIYQPHKNPEDDYAFQEGIWVGSRISPAVAIPAIKTAVAFWSQLRYLHLSTDGGDPPDYIHDQLFFGGSTETAVKRYSLQAWDVDELLQLDESMSLEDFHSIIRSRYP